MEETGRARSPSCVCVLRPRRAAQTPGSAASPVGTRRPPVHGGCNRTAATQGEGRPRFVVPLATQPTRCFHPSSHRNTLRVVALTRRHTHTRRCPSLAGGQAVVRCHVRRSPEEPRERWTQGRFPLIGWASMRGPDRAMRGVRRTQQDQWWESSRRRPRCLGTWPLQCTHWERQTGLCRRASRVIRRSLNSWQRSPFAPAWSVYPGHQESSSAAMVASWWTPPRPSAPP